MSGGAEDPAAGAALARLNTVRQRIDDAERRYGRAPGSVTLLAVSKTKPVEAIAALAAAGQRRFGENYLQEALQKIEALGAPRYGFDLEWHFIGPLQTNKTRGVAGHFAWMHSVDRLRIAERLSAQRPTALPPLNVLLQVNIDAEASKSGFAPDQLAVAAAAVAALPNLRLRGLMAIPAPRTGLEAQREPLRRLRLAQQALIDAGFALDTLSMGMSDDLEAAVAEGATTVRIGTALFGAREPRQAPRHGA